MTVDRKQAVFNRERLANKLPDDVIKPLRGVGFSVTHPSHDDLKVSYNINEYKDETTIEVTHQWDGGNKSFEHVFHLNAMNVKNLMYVLQKPQSVTLFFANNDQFKFEYVRGKKFDLTTIVYDEAGNRKMTLIPVEAIREWLLYSLRGYA